MLCGVCQHKHSLKGWDNTLSVPLRIFLTMVCTRDQGNGTWEWGGHTQKPNP